MRLGIPVSFPEWVNKCDCGQTLDIKGSDADGFHLLTCKNGGGPVWTHDSMMSVWSECLSSVHLPHKCEPRDRYTHSNNWPDILIYDSETGSNVELDVALAHPWASDILPHAATTGGSAANEKGSNQGKQVCPGTTTRWILANCRASCIRTFWPLGGGGESV